MIYKVLGKTGLKVSIIGFGASPLGAEFGSIVPEEGKRAVDYAIDQGINYFDVSPYYGRTLAEKRLGEFLKGKRDRIILATKVGRYGISLPDGFDFSARRVIKSVEESLQRLKTDYIDVFQIHDIEFGKRKQIIEETLPAMLQLQKKGKIRFIGITGYPLTPLKEIVETQEIDTVLSYCRYNLLDTTMDDILTPVAKKKRIGLINASPLHMRILTEKGAPDWHPAPEKVLKGAKEAIQFCQGRKVNISNLALQFAFSNKYVAITLVGMSKVKHVKSNLNNVGVKPDPDLLKKVREIIKPVTNIYWKEGLPENNDPNATEKRT
jgi:L-galactose dehydrogenase